MHRIILFAEDTAHESFVRALVDRLSREYAVDVALDVRSAIGGHGRVMRELRRYLLDVQRGNDITPDLLIVATDANCVGYARRRREVDDALSPFAAVIPAQCVIHAIPDPHVERWPLLDSRAFKAVLGEGCRAPDQKCQRDRYKQLLADSVRAAGVMPLFHGIEHIQDIVSVMDLDKVGRQDRSLGALIAELRLAYSTW